MRYYQALGLGLLVTGLGCSFSVPRSQVHPAVLAAPSATVDSPEAALEGVLGAARTDLGCEQVAVVTTLDRRYLNGSSVRYVVEGCGERALYVEMCELYPECHYLIVSRVVLGSAPAAARP